MDGSSRVRPAAVTLASMTDHSTTNIETKCPYCGNGAGLYLAPREARTKSTLVRCFACGDAAAATYWFREDEQAPTRPASPTGLYWSKRGEVACDQHAPDTNDPRWTNEKWKPLVHPHRNRGPHYQCVHCHGSSIK
jgi:hypothetical protein